MTRACRQCRIRRAMLLLITVAFAVCLAELVHRLRPRDAALSADPWSPPATVGAPPGDRSLPQLRSGQQAPTKDGVEVTVTRAPAASPPARRAPVAVESAENQPPSSAVGGSVLSPIFPSGLPLAVYRVLDGIWYVESCRGQNLRRGDGGKARSHFQQHIGHWRDGCEYLGVDWPWSDADNLERAAAVVVAYWVRYCPEALWRGDIEILARVHNGGPRGAGKAATLGYWRKVKEAMR